MAADPTSTSTFTAFREHTRVASGTLPEVAIALRELVDAGDTSLILVFDDTNGRQLDLDLSGPLAAVAARFGADASQAPPAAPSPPRRGRPKLGVVGREVTLLPRHWEWLQTQRGGPSATLRRLVDEARNAHRDRDRVRHAQDTIHRFLSAIAGDLPGFEEAIRALYRTERERFEASIATWPADVRSQIDRWCEAAFRAPPQDA